MQTVRAGLIASEERPFENVLRRTNDRPISNKERKKNTKRTRNTFEEISAKTNFQTVWHSTVLVLICFSFIFSSPEPKAHKVSLYSLPMVVVRRRRPHFQTRISLKPVGQS